MRFAWLVGVVAAAAPHTAAAGSGGAAFEPVPLECEAVRRALEETTASAEAAPLAPQRLAAAMTPICRRIIDDGGWPALSRTLASPPADATAPRALAERRRALCMIGAPEAVRPAEEWLVQRAAIADEGTCLLMVLRRDKAAFKRVAVVRLASAEQPPDAMSLIESVVSRSTADEWIWFLPTLENATTRREPGSARLYAWLCWREPARSQPACREYPGPEGARAKRRRVAWKLAVHVAVAVAYAATAWIVQRRRGRDAVSWPFVGFGATAVLVVTGLDVVRQSSAGAGALGALSWLAGVVVGIPLALTFGLGTAWILTRRAGFSPALLCLVESFLYSALIIAYGFRFW